MMSLRLYFSLLLGQFCCSYGFNLETRLPVIKRESQGSYFGFSVAEHQSYDQNKKEVQQNWLLVGAPLGQNLQPGTNNSGALWRCPITSLQNDCDQVITDGKRDAVDGHYNPYVDKHELTTPLSNEIKDGQWLGVTVRSQGTGGKVMVCAHRYIRSDGDFRYATGLCYTLTQYLDYDESWEPCKGKPMHRAHEEYGFCQAGASGLLVNDIALIGTPGPYTWRGTMFVFSIDEDYLHRDKTMYHSRLADDLSAPDKYSYLGMSVAAGKFFGPQMAYAAGAPRSNGTGQVFIYTKAISVTNLNLNMILSGEQFTSNFGYEIATADLNGDRLPDLLVGAPNYFTKDSGGAVYIYINHKHCLDCNDPIKITGQPESRYGIAIANLSDLNKDGYEDIAVGAPYEGYGTIYIYLGAKDGIINEPSQVIHGEEFNIRTFGYSISGGLDLDGNSYPDLMTGAFEADAVVLLRARPIVGLTTWVEPDSSLSNIDPNNKACEHSNSNHTCFRFTACVSMEAIDRRLVVSENGVIRLKYKLEADVHKKIPRVWLHNKHHGKTHTIQHEIGLHMDTTTREWKHCHHHTVFVKDGTKDIQSAISMRLNYWLVQAEPKKPLEGDPLPSVDNFPILNQQQAAQVFDATFLKDCGKNDICESGLVVDAFLVVQTADGDRYNTSELVLGEHQEIILNATVYNINESAYEAQLQIKHSSSLSYIGQIKQKDKTHTCLPDNSKEYVLCNIGNPLERSGSANVVLRFDPRGLTDSEYKIEFTLSPNTTSTPVEPMMSIIRRATIIRKAELSLKGLARPEQVFYGGEVKGESAMVYKDDIGSRIVHTYQVVNQGPWRVSQLELSIDWPYQVANNKPLGKWLLYMDEKPYVEALSGGECSMPHGAVNPLGLLNRPGFFDSPLDSKHTSTPTTLNSTFQSDVSIRRKRDLEMVVRTEPYIDRDGQRHDIVNMNCERGSAKCFKFRCVINMLQKNQEATVFIRARLWNATLVEDYPHAYLVKIASKAKIHIPSSTGIHQNPSDDETEIETVARTELFKQQMAEGVALWIILVACLFGILLLLLLIVILWKLGFFKRRRPDPTLSGNLEKHRVDDYHDY